MAFQDVNPKTTKDPVKLTALKVGESVTGHIVGFNPSKQNPDNMNIIMVDEKGDRFFVYTAGNVKYLISDGKVKSGQLTKITRLDDRKMKNGKITSAFQVLQDPDSVVATQAPSDFGSKGKSEDEQFDDLGEEPAKPAAKPTLSVKEQAQRISAAMKKNG
jgi:hypothetical protein